MCQLCVYGKNILISGAFENESKKSSEIGKFAETLSTWLMTQNCKIFTGYGKNLGKNIVSGSFSGCKLRTNEKSALQTLPVVSVSQRVTNNFSSRVFLFPFPDDVSMTSWWAENIIYKTKRKYGGKH